MIVMNMIVAAAIKSYRHIEASFWAAVACRMGSLSFVRKSLSFKGGLKQRLICPLCLDRKRYGQASSASVFKPCR